MFLTIPLTLSKRGSIMGKSIAYLRVSTNHQDIQSQKYEILDYCHKNEIQIDEFIEVEMSSRKSLDKRKIDILINDLREGDQIIVSELSRIGRSTGEVLNIINGLIAMGVNIRIIKQNMNLTDNGDMQSKVMVTMFSLFAELERDLISQRTKRALEARKAAGVKLGRKKGSLGKSKLDDQKDTISDLISKKVSISSIAKILGVSRGTVYNFIRSRNLNTEFK